MKHKTVAVNNIANLMEAGEALLSRSAGMPGMGLLWGETGYGKTTAVTWYINQVNGIYVRAMATWTPSAMLETILDELGRPAPRRIHYMIREIVASMSQEARVLFVDEADYIIENKKLTETLRDLHDLTGMPVILIGMSGIQRKLRGSKQLSGRMAQWVEFHKCDIGDAKKLATTLCEVAVSDELLVDLHGKARGSIRLLVVGLGQIEMAAKNRGLSEVTLNDWQQWAMKYFIGDAPGA